MVTVMLVSVVCHIELLTCIVSFKSENFICWTEAVPLRGMFTAVLQMTKLVWRQKKTEGLLSSISDSTSASTHGYLRGKRDSHH